MNWSIDILDALFGGHGRTAILRLLAAQSSSLTGTQIAELTGLSQAGASRALDHFAGLGVIKQRRVGRAVLHELERDNLLVSEIVVPAVQAERTLIDGVREELAARVSERVTLVPLAEIERLTGSSPRPDLSSVIWDVDLSTLDEERNADFIIRRVLEAGRPEQLAWLFRRYGEARIEQVAGRERGLPHPAAVAWQELLRRRRERIT